ncbi:sodium:solute symporter family protein [Streptomyces sp. T028]|uniref:sodium:solute symporter family protein n=1 Tax=Streptomyces sp. T028 TaxID=3394379 RepID=UPI003A840175
MNLVIGYGAVAAFFVALIAFLERSRRAGQDITEYAVAGRSFGSWYQTMSFLNTWLPGTVFITFAGLAASAGIIGFYWVPYSLLTLVLMHLMARTVHDWGRRWNLRTQADLLGMRYGSRPVRVVAALIGVVASFPWIVLGMQSLGLVFSYLSFGRVSPQAAIVIGIGFLLLRQIWTVRLGMRGIVVSDVFQGLVAYGLGGLLILGLIADLLVGGHDLAALPAAYFTLPGPGSPEGALYLMSLILTGALGSWCWPDMFVRFFTARDAETVRRSAVQAAPWLFLFSVALTLLALLAGSVPGVAEAPSEVFFLLAERGGPFVLALAGVVVLAATMGNVDANFQALGVQVSQNLLPVRDGDSDAQTRAAKRSVGVLTVLAALTAAATLHTGAGLVSLAILSYQAICQLAPALYLGMAWRRGNATGAVAGMVAGSVTAALLQLAHPVSVPWLAGLTSGVAGLAVNTAVYVLAALLLPRSAEEQARVGNLFARPRSLGSQAPEPTNA